MKKKIYVLVAFLMMGFTTMAADVKDDKKAPELTEQQQVRIQEIKQRVEEIKSMDKSSLSREERKELKSELKAMKKEARAMGGGVYLSVGAIIIIILVLILIL
ncbi:hypothetical protein [Hufsiella ginkgonis]|uniref:Seryl-tRNA synthetase n=1 Tax=Hufsiella ginkgonis TaxID=2695274 RepID=A0A7K1XXF4_9SPHI|nr:hypothetical protein [Hufsiella ginkgonis]MXV15508.1 hypothetical protein [Hufsiella ginkgonis]